MTSHANRRSSFSAVAKTLRLPRPLARRAEAEARRRHVALDSLIANALESYIDRSATFLRELDALNERAARDRGNEPLASADEFSREELHERRDVC